MLRTLTKELSKDTLPPSWIPTASLPNVRQKIRYLKQFAFYCYMPWAGLFTKITMILHGNIANVYERAVCRDV